MWNFLLFLVIALWLLVSFSAVSTPLDDYVWAEDSHYSWVDTGEIIEGSSVDGSHHWKGYILNMTSQQWLTPEGLFISVFLFLFHLFTSCFVHFSLIQQM